MANTSKILRTCRGVLHTPEIRECRVGVCNTPLQRTQTDSYLLRMKYSEK